MICKAEHTPHVGRFNKNKLMGGGIFAEYPVKYTSVVQIFGDSDSKCLVGCGVFLFSQIQSVVDQEYRAHDQREDCGESEVSHTRDKSCAHPQKEGAYLFRCAGDGAETDKAEGARHGNACSHISVDHHDDHADDCWQKRQRHYKAFRIAGAVHIGQRHDKAKREGNAEAEQKIGHRDDGGELCVK